MRKRMLALLLAVVLMTALLPMSALAADAPVPYSGKINSYLKWKFVPGTGTLTISGVGDMPDYYAVFPPTAPWSHLRDYIVTVVVEQNTSRIGNNSFYGCNKLEYVSLPSTLDEIGECAFERCSNLETVYMEPGMQLETVESQAFHECTYLKSIKLPNTVTTIGERAFYGCRTLQEFDLPNSLTAIEDYTFYNCDSLETIEIPSSVKTIGEHAFSSCDCLMEVKMYEGLTNIDNYAFAYCNGLERLNIPQGITRINDGVFYSCDGLKELTIPTTVSHIGYDAFNGSIFDEIGITYEGNCKQWKQISVYGGNQMLENANIKMTHNPLLQNKKEATCVLDGYTGDLICTDCNEVTKQGEWTPVVDHQYVNWICTGCGKEEPIVTDNPFTDVFTSDWYFRPVLWAVGANVTGGKTANTFAPNESCTRAQVVTFLWAANGKPNPKSTVNPFDDVNTGDWYYKPVLWAVENGITGGVAAHAFGPDQTCTRAQVVTFLWAAEGKPDPKSNYNPFEDVGRDAWYLKPVLWAVENEITSGISDGKFGSDQSCTRAQVVTFLNKVYGK